MRCWCRIGVTVAVAALAGAAVGATLPGAYAVPLSTDSAGRTGPIWKMPPLPPGTHWTVRRPADPGVLEVPADLRTRAGGDTPGPAPRYRPVESAPGLAGARAGSERVDPRSAARRPVAGPATGLRRHRPVADLRLLLPGLPATTGLFRDLPPRPEGVFAEGAGGKALLFGVVEQSRAARARRIAADNLERGEVDLDRPRPLRARDGQLGVVVTAPRFGPRRAQPVCVYDLHGRGYRCLIEPGL